MGWGQGKWYDSREDGYRWTWAQEPFFFFSLASICVCFRLLKMQLSPEGKKDFCDVPP